MVRTGATENFNDPTALAWEQKAQEAFKAADANNTKFWDYLFGVQREVSDKIESDGRRVLRENIERMRAEAPQPMADAPPPVDVMARPENQRPVSEATGKTQVSLLQQIAKAVGVKDPQAVFTIAGAAGGN
jgi:hypothetical protein